MAGDITGATAIYTLSISSVFPAPFQLQGFAADDVADAEPLEVGEFLMGVDGVLSAGFIFVAFRQSVTLQADSDSNFLFDTWYIAEQAARQKFPATGTIIMPAIGTKYTLQNGKLTTYMPMPNVKKLLQPRRFAITWERVTPAIIV